MDNKKYNELRNKIEKKGFEGKNESLSKWLYYFSFFGNIGSIFFATFFVFPILYLAISMNLVSGNISTILAVVGSIIILSVFEILKRKTLTNLSFDLINSKYNIFKSFGNFIISILLIGFSFYFSLNGAIEFVSTNDVFTEELTINLTTDVDSIKRIYNNKIKTYEDDNEILRKINNQLRDKIVNTPINYKTIRQEYQKNINVNQELIISNDLKIDSLREEEKDSLAEYEDKNKTIINNNKKEDNRNILLFIFISSFIEIIIIAGISFKEYYDIFVFKLNKDRLEPIYLKRKKYLTILKYLYRGGILKQGDYIIGISKLKEIVNDRSKLTNVNKFINEFIDDMTRFDILELKGKKRYIKVTYEKAINIINNMDDSLQILDTLN